MKPVQMMEPDRVGFIRRQGESSGNMRTQEVYFHSGRWWDVLVVSRRYDLYEVSPLPAEESIWATPEDAETDLIALAIARVD